MISGKKMLLIMGLTFVILFSGCTESTPKGDINAPVNNTVANNVSTVSNASGSAKESFSIGETATTENSLQVTVTKVARLENCSMDGSCIGVYVKVKNTSSDKQDDSMPSAVILDDQGKQYGKEYIYCPNSYPIDFTGLYPSASKEGWLCFKNVPGTVQSFKIVLPISIVQMTNLVYLVKSTELQKIQKSAEMSVEGLKADSYSYGSATIKGTLKVTNKSEIYLNNFKLKYVIKQGDTVIAENDDETILLYNIEPGKSQDNDLLIMEEIPSPGDYTIEFTLSDKEGELAKVSSNLKVEP